MTTGRFKKELEQCQARVAVLEARLATATAFLVDDGGHPFAERVMLVKLGQDEDPRRWAIQKGGACLSDRLLWELNPRTGDHLVDAYIDRTRHATTEEALARWTEFQAAGGEKTYRERLQACMDQP